MKRKSKNHKININKYQTNFLLELSRGIKLGIINLWRNKLLSIATILVIAVMICIFNSILAVNQITQNALQTINQKVDIVFYLNDNISFSEANAMREKLENLEGIKTVEYISKEEALQLVSETYPETADFLIKFNLENPLPPSISIITKSADDYDQVISYINKSRFSEYIDYSQQDLGGQNQQMVISKTAENLVGISNFVKQLIFWTIFIFLIGGALIIINAIQLTIYTRKNEIFVMRLVGATPNFIRLPFLTEGIAYAVLSVLLSYLMIYIVSFLIGIENLLFNEVLNSINLPNIILLQIILTIALSVLASGSTVQKYLNKKLVFN
ncbi:FtsX-like permease family protein [Candidatus Peregrinibacteria bacterium]|nr:FtsX-like permease family protein [Candidatus Peregrinibacteria bacterium]